MAKDSGLISDVHNIVARFGNFVLTKSGSLVGAIEIEGKDSDGLNQFDFAGISLMAQGTVFQKLPEKMIITQYFIHSESAEVSFRKRNDPIVDCLIKNRSDFLNKKSLSTSRIIMFFELPPDDVLVKLGFLDQIKHLCLSPFIKTSRDALLSHFSSKEIILLVEREMVELEERLSDFIDETASKWESLLVPRVLSVDETWHYMKFLANLNPYYLDEHCPIAMPEGRLDGAIADGDVFQVAVGSVDCMKIVSEEATYASIYSVNNFGTQRVTPGMWASGDKPPVRMRGNYVLMLRFKKNSQLQTGMMFNKKKGEIDRKQFSLASVFKDKNNLNDLEKRQLMKKSIRVALEDLDEAEALDVDWGRAHACCVVWDTDIHVLRKSRKRLKVSMDQAGFHGCWESVGLKRAFKAFQPTGFDYSLRNVPFNTAQLAATSLLYRSSEGQKSIEDLGGEEALYVFQSADGSPFYFSPWVGGKNLVIGVGPIRSGKSFTKNTLASHFSKYGGFLQGIDVDIGLEPVARLYGKNGGVFKTGHGESLGFNPFVSCRGYDDMDFFHHLKSQIVAMLSTNDTESMRQLELAEQVSLDKAIKATMAMPPKLQRLATVYTHCSTSLKRKLERWVSVDGRVGVYASYFDADVDSVGSIEKRVMAYNLMSIKDNVTIMPLVMSEIFYRVSRIFLNEDHRSKPKYLDIDECKTLFMSSPDAVARIVKIIRTMGKYQGGVGLWTQNVEDYATLQDWDALRSAASTFFFMADPEMNPKSYKETFHLTEGECEAIQTLVPKREAYIVQRDLGISKKVSLEVDAEQYLISTSKAAEVELREKLIQELGYEQGMEEAVKQLGENNGKVTQFNQTAA